MKQYIPGIIANYCNDINEDSNYTKTIVNNHGSFINSIEDVSYITLYEMAKEKIKLLKNSKNNEVPGDFFGILENTIKNNYSKIQNTTSDIKYLLQKEKSLEQTILNIEKMSYNYNDIDDGTDIISLIKNSVNDHNVNSQITGNHLCVSNNHLKLNNHELEYKAPYGFYYLDSDNNKHSVNKNEILTALYHQLKDKQQQIQEKLDFADIDSKLFNTYKKEYQNFLIEGSKQETDQVKLIKTFKTKYDEEIKQLSEANSILQENIDFNQQFNKEEKDDEEEYEIDNNVFQTYFQQKNNNEEKKNKDERQELIDKINKNVKFMEAYLQKKYYAILGTLENQKKNEKQKHYNDNIAPLFKQIKDEMQNFCKRKTDKLEMKLFNDIISVYHNELQTINMEADNKFHDTNYKGEKINFVDPKINFLKNEKETQTINELYNAWKKEIEENKRLQTKIKQLNNNIDYFNKDNDKKINHLQEVNNWLEEERNKLQYHINELKNQKQDNISLKKTIELLQLDNKKLKDYNAELKAEVDKNSKSNLLDEADASLCVGISTSILGVGTGTVGGLGAAGVIAMPQALFIALIVIAAICIISSIVAFSNYTEKSNKADNITSLSTRNQQIRQQKQNYEKNNENVNNNKLDKILETDSLSI